MPSDFLRIICWAAWLWAFYPLHDIINEHENKSIEAKISEWLVLISLIGIVFWVAQKNEIEFFDATTCVFFTLLMAGLSLEKWASIRKIPEDLLAQDISKLACYSKLKCEPGETGQSH
jgi:ABC-type siderophore export system fused ATPase/permease subunit